MSIGANLLTIDSFTLGRTMKVVSREVFMKKLINASKNTKDYDLFLKNLYARAKQEPEALVVPPVQIIAVDGNQPPSSAQYQDAIAALYGIAYTLKMGLKFNKLPLPKGYFDYKVGALETLWWSSSGTLDINNPKTLHWKVYLMVPRFITKKLFAEAVVQAQQKDSTVNYDSAHLEKFAEGSVVQVLHVGPYADEKRSVDKLLHFAKKEGLAFSGRHHEIYMSDPRRTAPNKLKTVVRYPVKRAIKARYI